MQAVMANAYGSFLPNIWQGVWEEEDPQLSDPKDDLSSILRAGMILQKAVICLLRKERPPSATESALDSLNRHSRLAPMTVIEKRREKRISFLALCTKEAPELLNVTSEQIAAAYHLWPWYAARIYADLGSTPKEIIGAHTSLRMIQVLLFLRPRSTIDACRSWFGCWSDADLASHVAGEKRTWRDELVKLRKPDLAAVDSLIHDMIEMESASPLMRDAIYLVQRLAVSGSLQDGDKLAICREALHQLGVAQVTLFSTQDPSQVPRTFRKYNHVPMVELVNHLDKEEAAPDELFPFDTKVNGEWTRDPDRLPFRKLANAVFSSESETSAFFRHAQATLTNLADTRIISDGRVTNLFLRGLRDPTYVDRYKGLNFPWLNHSVRDVLEWKSFNDWDHSDWWTDLGDSTSLFNKLFPSCDPNLNQNAHVCSFRDYWLYQGHVLQDDQLQDMEKAISFIATNTRTEKNIPAERRSPDKFGYLLDLILRRQESEARTGFIFALARTHAGDDDSLEMESPQDNILVQFAGGTFIGLERPGIPFEPARFYEVCQRVRPLVISLAHYGRTRLEKKLYAVSKQYEGTVRRVLAMMEGKAPPFDRSGVLMFSVDHARDTESSTSRNQIRDFFQPHWFDEQNPRKIDIKCDHTWKALFCLDNNSNKVDIESLRGELKLRESDRELPVASTHHIRCSKCFRTAVTRIVGDFYAKDIEIKFQQEPLCMTLPARPGIRFLLAVCDFIQKIQGDRARGAAVQEITFSPGRLSITLSGSARNDLLKHFYNWVVIGPPDHLGDLYRAFSRLRRSEVPMAADDSVWQKFLTAPEYQTPLLIVPESESIDVRWVEI